MSVEGVKGFTNKIPAAFNERERNGVNENTVPFIDYLTNALNKTNNLIVEADKLSEDFAAGKTDNIHQVLIAAEKANIALQFTLQVRNKIIDAYNEIMRMQI